MAITHETKAGTNKKEDNLDDDISDERGEGFIDLSHDIAKNNSPDVVDGATKVIQSVILKNDDSQDKSKSIETVNQHLSDVVQNLSNVDDKIRSSAVDPNQKGNNSNDNPGEKPDKDPDLFAKPPDEMPVDIISNDNSPPGKLPVSDDELLDMISRPFVEPDIVQNIFGRVEPMDVVSLELALPPLSTLFSLYGDIAPLTGGGEVVFDYVRWGRGGRLTPCGRADEDAFVRLSLDGTYVTAIDVSCRWLALGYYSGAVRVMDRHDLSLSKWVYSRCSREGDGGKIVKIWLVGDTSLVALDRFNMLTVRNIHDMDTVSRTTLGDSLVEVVVQKDICLQVFDNEDSFGLAVFRLEENKLNLFQEFPIPKVVTSNIIKVSLNTSSKLVLVYYEEEMLDYKTWRNIELFGGHLGHHFQEFYAAFIGGRPYSTSGRKTKFLALINYETGALVKQYHLRVGSALTRALDAPISAMVGAGEGREENLWKMLRKAFKEDKSSSHPFNRIHTHQFVWGGFGVVREEEESNFDSASRYLPNAVLPGEESFRLQKFPFSILSSKRSEFLKNHPWEAAVQPSFTRLRPRSTMTEDSHDLEEVIEKVCEEGEDQLTVPGEMVTNTVFYDHRSLVYHISEKDEDGEEEQQEYRARVTLLDMWNRDWETEHGPVNLANLPELVASSNDEYEEDSDEDDTSDEDGNSDNDGEGDLLLEQALDVQAMAMAIVEDEDEVGPPAVILDEEVD